MSKPKMKFIIFQSLITTILDAPPQPPNSRKQPSGEVTINMGITGPHYTIGAACAAGNAGIIQATQILDWVKLTTHLLEESVGVFKPLGFLALSQGALAKHDDPNQASRPFDTDRNGIVM